MEKVWILVSQALCLARCVTYIQNRKPFVAEGADQVAEKSDTQEDKEGLPGVGLEDADALVIHEDIDAANEEKRSSELHGKSDRDLA